MPLAVLFIIQFHKFQITEKKIIQKGQSTVVTGSQLSVNCLQRAKKRLVDLMKTIDIMARTCLKSVNVRRKISSIVKLLKNMSRSFASLLSIDA